MSGPQIEDGYTRIANELIQAIYKSDFSAMELRILLFVIRSTYGFSKKEHQMSYAFIANGIGKNRRSVVRTVQDLVTQRSLVTRASLGRRNSNFISLNKNYLEWEKYKTSDMGVTSIGSDSGVTRGSDNLVLELVTPASPKKEKEKRKIKKEKNLMSSKLDNANLSASHNRTKVQSQIDAMLKKAAVDIIDFLNEKTGRNFKHIDANHRPIICRIREGIKAGQTIDDMLSTSRAIIAKKFREWSVDEKMLDYLRPATLFGKQKFWAYEGQLGLSEEVKRYER